MQQLNHGGIMETTAFELLSFIKEATSPFHVVEQCRQMLRLSGFEELNIESPWSLKTGKRLLLS